MKTFGLASILSASLSASLLLPAAATGFGDSSKLVVAQVRYDGGNPNPRPNAIPRAAWEVMKRTSIEMELEPKFVSLTDESLFYYPFLYLAGSSSFPALDEKDILVLRRYLGAGGFMFIDSSDEGDGFDASVRRELSRVFPNRTIEKIPEDSVLYKSFYMINGQAGRLAVRPYMEALKLGSRLAVVYSRNDVAGAWSRDNFGNWEFEVAGGEAGREMAFRLGVNVFMYALNLDYKDDLVHAPYILKRRK